MYFNKAISLACKMLASRRPFRVQVSLSHFPWCLAIMGIAYYLQKYQIKSWNNWKFQNLTFWQNFNFFKTILNKIKEGQVLDQVLGFLKIYHSFDSDDWFLRYHVYDAKQLWVN
jgi:hypothetical protein